MGQARCQPLVALLFASGAARAGPVVTALDEPSPPHHVAVALSLAGDSQAGSADGFGGQLEVALRAGPRFELAASVLVGSPPSTVDSPCAGVNGGCGFGSAFLVTVEPRLQLASLFGGELVVEGRLRALVDHRAAFGVRPAVAFELRSNALRAGVSLGAEARSVPLLAAREGRSFGYGGTASVWFGGRLVGGAQRALAPVVSAEVGQLPWGDGKAQIGAAQIGLGAIF